MSTKSRQSIYGASIMGAKIRAQSAREAAKKAAREADRAEAEIWSIHGGYRRSIPRSRSLIVARAVEPSDNWGYWDQHLAMLRGLPDFVGKVKENISPF
jgi:hypothetical protein